MVRLNKNNQVKIVSTLIKYRHSRIIFEWQRGNPFKSCRASVKLNQNVLTEARRRLIYFVKLFRFQYLFNNRNALNFLSQ